MKSFIQRLICKDILSEDEIELICQKAIDMLIIELNIIHVKSPVVVVGDLHGQLTLLSIDGHPPKSKYIFLGDYVDRGPMSIQLILILLCFKVLYPLNIFLLITDIFKENT